MYQRLALAALTVGLLACSPNAVATPDAATLEEIATPLIHRVAITSRCGEPDDAALERFLVDLADLDADAAARWRARADEVIADAAAEEPEYLCTPEMFEHSEHTAQAAIAAWGALRRP